MPQIRVGRFAAEKITEEHGPERSEAGQPSEWDFWSGPLAAALIGFRDFENLPFDLHPEIRTLHIVDPVFGIGVMTVVQKVIMSSAKRGARSGVPAMWAPRTAKLALAA